MKRIRRLWSEKIFVIIAVLSMASLILYANYAVNDRERRSHLASLRVALNAYGKSNGGNYRLPAGYDGLGAGWVFLPYGEFPSLSEALKAKGFLRESIPDDPVLTPGYMLYLCDEGRRYTLWATLSWPTRAESEEAKAGCKAFGPNGAIDTYGKNYAVGN